MKAEKERGARRKPLRWELRQAPKRVIISAKASIIRLSLISVAQRESAGVPPIPGHTQGYRAGGIGRMLNGSCVRDTISAQFIKVKRKEIEKRKNIEEKSR